MLTYYWQPWRPHHRRRRPLSAAHCAAGIVCWYNLIKQCFSVSGAIISATVMVPVRVSPSKVINRTSTLTSRSQGTGFSGVIIPNAVMARQVSGLSGVIAACAAVTQNRAGSQGRKSSRFHHISGHQAPGRDDDNRQRHRGEKIPGFGLDYQDFPR